MQKYLLVWHLCHHGYTRSFCDVIEANTDNIMEEIEKSKVKLTAKVFPGMSMQEEVVLHQVLPL